MKYMKIKFNIILSLYLSLIALQLKAQVHIPFDFFSCKEDQTSTPPFYVSDAYKQGSKAWENIRNQKGLATHYIPRGSIVYSPLTNEQIKASPEARIPIEVLSVLPESNDINLQKSTWFKHMTQGKNGQKRASKGVTGFIHKNSIQDVGNFIFMVKNESTIFPTPEDESFSFEKSYGLIINKNENGKYPVKNCCISKGQEKLCITQYKFEVIDSNLKVVKEFYQDAKSCRMDIMDPVPVDDFQAISKFLTNSNSNLTQLDALQTNKEYKTPYMIKNLDSLSSGTIQYNPDDKVNSDSYLRPWALCAFNNVVKKFQEKCSGPGCKIQFGNCFHKTSWGTHESHESGECIDLRPMRKDDDEENGLTYRDPRYSREKTLELLNLAVAAGGENIYFNDPKIYKNTKGITFKENHHNHLHICFPSDSIRVRQACTDTNKDINLANASGL